MIEVPEQSVVLARRFEGLRLKSYRCPAMIWTVGYGATGADIGPGMVVTREWAENRLQRDLGVALRQTIKLCPVLLLEPEDRLAAIVDFVFNLGSGRLAASTLRKRINAQEWERAGDELLKWVWGGGKKLPGLILRRETERRLLITA